MSGQIQLLADPMLSSLPLAQAGKIKALALTSLKRVACGARDSDRRGIRGMKGFEFVSWYGSVGPKNLPADIVNKLQADIRQGAGAAGGEAAAGRLGFEPIGSTSAEFAKYIDDEMAKYAQDHHGRQDQDGMSE